MTPNISSVLVVTVHTYSDCMHLLLCRSRDVRDTDRSPSPRRHTRSDKPEKKSKSKSVKVSEEDEEIKQANALRKSLGIKPLRTD